jgi:hypothetical protein
MSRTPTTSYVCGFDPERAAGAVLQLTLMHGAKCASRSSKFYLQKKTRLAGAGGFLDIIGNCATCGLRRHAHSLRPLLG